jgi:hypothetical protein
MAFTVRKGTLGPIDSGVIVAQSMYIPVATSISTGSLGAGGEAFPTSTGATVVTEYEVAFNEVSGTAPVSSSWRFPAPAGKWRMTDCLFHKTGSQSGSSGDTVRISSVKSGATGSITLLNLSGSGDGTLVRPTFRSYANSVSVLDSSAGDYVEVVLTKNTSSVSGILRLNLALEP